jgi:hypothetical protein
MKATFAAGVITGLAIYHHYIYRHRRALGNYRRQLSDVR